MSEIKIRSSQVGNIMTDARGKSIKDKFTETKESLSKKRDRLNSLSAKAEKTRERLTHEIETLELNLSQYESRLDEVNLSETCKSYLEEVFWKREFNISSEIVNKYLTKGIEVEDDSINLACDVHGWNNQKNNDSFENDFLTGTPDMIFDEFIVDIKSSWSAKTFPLKNENDDIPSQLYYYQIMSYLALTGKSHGFLIYCLVDTPENLVQDELWRYARNHGLLEVPTEIEDEIRESHLFSRLPKKLRVKTFRIDRDEEVIQKIYERIDDCRKWYNKNLLTQIF
jgi:hypothetical protein